MRHVLLPAAIAAAAIAAPASASIIAEFALSDHTGGNVSPPVYGMRLDGFLGGITGFSFGQFNNTTLVVDDDLGNLRITISGTVWGGEIANHAYTNPAAYDVEFVWVDGVVATADGWRVEGNSLNNKGTLIPMSGLGTEVLTITDNFNNSFIFEADGDRLPNDDTTWVGRGWITTNPDGSSTGGAQDWLFIGEPIPTPASGAMMLAGALLTFRRKR